MKHKYGFISMSLVYSFLILFLFVMLSIISTYSEKNKYLDAINEQVENDINNEANDTKSIITEIFSNYIVLSLDSIDLSSKADNSVGNGKGLFNTEIDNEKIYFFRGEDVNNYVELADMCFRILRTNTDGSLRLVYQGKYDSTSGCSDDTDLLPSITSSDYSSSEVVNTLNNWYKNTDLKDYNINESGNDKRSSDICTTIPDENFITDTEFCSDKSYSEDRLTNPTYDCDDSYTYSLSEKYNGNKSDTNALNISIGLLTADEVIYAGGQLNTSSDFFLKSEYNYWTMTPNGNAEVYYVSSDGSLMSTSTDSQDIYIRPVLSIYSSISIKSGDGTKSNPYIFVEEEKSKCE